MLTHPGTKLVWRRATTLIEANALPLSQTVNQYNKWQHKKYNQIAQSVISQWLNTHLYHLFKLLNIYIFMINKKNDAF